MARVQVLKEVMEDKSADKWRLCFQWCRYVYDDDKEPQKGYRFIWRRPESEGGGLQAARGQARIPSIAKAQELIEKAKADGWGGESG